MPASVTPARQVAFDVLRRTFEQGAFTDRAFRSAATRASLEGRDRAQAQQLAYGAVQRRGTTDFLINRLARRPVNTLDPPLQAALRLGIFELLFADGTPDHAAINEAVELVRLGGAPRAAGLANAVLRRVTRERSAITNQLAKRETPSQLAVAESLPPWLAEKWWQELGPDDARELAASVNRPAGRALRVNTERWTVEEAFARAEAEGIDLAPAALESVPLPEMVSVRGSWAAVEPWIEAGLATPQSLASAAVVALLDPQPGEHILDLCAGPGTKSGQVAARMAGQGELIAVEKDEGRAGETADQMQRLGIHLASVIEADASRADLRGPGFDRVLVDAPCSDLGALNSRPDARWRKSPDSIARLAELQAAILENAAQHLRPGGVLVYSTCTISVPENEERALALLEATGQATDEESATLIADDLGADHPRLASKRDSRFLQIRPDRQGTTGFFIARFRRR